MPADAMNAPLLAIVGPTATGKSDLAVHLAQVFQGEIVNADSRHFYRFMDIGTAKPSQAQRAAIPHHLIDIIDPDAEFSLALYLRKAEDAIQGIRSRGKLPILVGGSGQYVWALLEGWKVPQARPDPELRDRLRRRAAEEGVEHLYQELTQVDPEGAGAIDPRNIRRVVRALEVYYTLGTPFSRSGGKRTDGGLRHCLILGLTMERKALYLRIDARVDSMVQEGWVEEVRRLLSMGCGPHLPSMSGIGYQEIVQYLEGNLTLAEALQRSKYRTHKFARRQYAWFSLKDQRIRWLQAGPDAHQEAEALVSQFLRD